jgi:2',3'-cyclic-nucleotide 2'-phosphodiesterase (5'-nucleotidase family)
VREKTEKLETFRIQRGKTETETLKKMIRNILRRISRLYCSLLFLVCLLSRTSSITTSATNTTTSASPQASLTLIFSSYFGSEDGKTAIGKNKGGYPRWKTKMDQLDAWLQKEPTNVFKIHTGNLLGMTPFGQYSQGVEERRFMEELGYEMIGLVGALSL